MKKWTALISLLLALLILPCALAEDAYVPGEVAKQLVADAFASGKIIKGDVKLRLDADPAALGLDEEDAAIYNAIVPLLDSVSVGLGLGKTEGGIRVEADAYLAHAQGGEHIRKGEGGAGAHHLPERSPLGLQPSAFGLARRGATAFVGGGGT